MDHHGVGQLFNHLDRSNPSGAEDGQTLSTELINHREHPDLTTISISDKDKVTKGNPCGT
jgi:hypothetical protein